MKLESKFKLGDFVYSTLEATPDLARWIEPERKHYMRTANNSVSLVIGIRLSNDREHLLYDISSGNHHGSVSDEYLIPITSKKEYVLKLLKQRIEWNEKSLEILKQLESELKAKTDEQYETECAENRK